MAITSTTNKVTYTGNATASVFPYAFKIFANTELEVDQILISTEAVTRLALTTDYTVSGVGESTGGNVTLVAGALSALYKLTIRRVLPLTQLVDFIENDSAPAETFEESYDRDTMIAQQLQETLDRCLKLKVYSSGITVEIPDPDANYYLGWNSDGTALENKIAISLGDADLDTDGTLAANSDTRVASQKATKTYVDTNIEINTETAKTTPVSADIALIEDSAATWARKKVTLANLTKGLGISAATEKTAPVAADELLIADTEASDALKKITIQRILNLVTTATSGIITIWSGAISAIPSGYVICDGNNSTPNLTDRFVIHADADAAGTNNVGATGGASTHALSTAELAAHTHTIPTYTNGGAVPGTTNYLMRGQEGATSNLTSGSAGSGTAHTNRDKFYALAFIMKT